jgi:uncharacterized protein (TIRG00374 family)
VSRGRLAGKLAAKLALSFAVGAVCLWLAARRVEMTELRTALAGFEWRYLVLLVLISLLIQIFRAWRWKLELSPLARLPFVLVWEVIAVAYMMINVLPFRLGEPVRPILLSWKTKLSIPAIVGNWVFEKMMDMAAIVFFVHLALLTTNLPSWAHDASAASLSIFAVLTALVVGFWLKGETVVAKALGRVLPDKACAWTLHVLSSARSGLQILPNKKLVGVVFVVTLLLWFLPILSSYVLILGFGFNLPFAAALVVFVAISAGTALPAPPAMIGVFQFACSVALGLFGVRDADALAYGLVLNAVQIVTLIAQGLIALPFLGVGVGALTRAAVESPESHAAAAK